MNEYHFCLNCREPINGSCICNKRTPTEQKYELKQIYQKPKQDYTNYKGKWFGYKQLDTDYWIKQHKIPLGTYHHPYSYQDWENIPDDEICTISYQDARIDLTKREAFNILFLGKSGGGKSKMLKNIVFPLRKSDFWIVAIEPKGFAWGGAREKWSEQNSFLAPHTKFEGIPIAHYVPNWVKRSCENRTNNKINEYKFYDIKLSWLTDIEMWESLGIGTGASKLVQIIKHYNDNKMKITLDILEREIRRLDKEEINTNSKNDMLGKIERIKAIGLIGEQKLDFYKEFKEKKMIVISYNLSDRIYMAFDIGMIIKRLSKLNQTLPLSERRPIMIIPDDGSIYLQKLYNGRFNFAMNEVQYIGNNYRSEGLNNACAVQSMQIIDDTVSETYQYKIISPTIPYVNQLQNIGIPYRAIELLKLQYLTIEPENHIIEHLLVNPKNEVVHFFPFTPPCEHLKDADVIDNTYSDEWDL